MSISFLDSIQNTTPERQEDEKNSNRQRLRQKKEKRHGNSAKIGDDEKKQVDVKFAHSWRKQRKENTTTTPLIASIYMRTISIISSERNADT